MTGTIFPENPTWLLRRAVNRRIKQAYDQGGLDYTAFEKAWAPTWEIGVYPKRPRFKSLRLQDGTRRGYLYCHPSADAMNVDTQIHSETTFYKVLGVASGGLRPDPVKHPGLAFLKEVYPEQLWDLVQDYVTIQRLTLAVRLLTSFNPQSKASIVKLYRAACTDVFGYPADPRINPFDLTLEALRAGVLEGYTCDIGLYLTEKNNITPDFYGTTRGFSIRYAGNRRGVRRVRLTPRGFPFNSTAYAVEKEIAVLPLKDLSDDFPLSYDTEIMLLTGLLLVGTPSETVPCMTNNMARYVRGVAGDPLNVVCFDVNLLKHLREVYKHHLYYPFPGGDQRVNDRLAQYFSASRPLYEYDEKARRFFGAVDPKRDATNQNAFLKFCADFYNMAISAGAQEGASPYHQPFHIYI